MTAYKQFDRTFSGRTHLVTTKLRTRRCDHIDRGDEAQIEVAIYTSKHGSNRVNTTVSSLVLTPAEARDFALSICPELLK
ncbi:MAG: hypothetical protein ACO1N8_11310 [Methylophilus sp.]